MKDKKQVAKIEERLDARHVMPKK
nr:MULTISPECIES: hypothetical protein [Bacillus]